MTSDSQLYLDPLPANWPMLSSDNARVIATGHQAWLWHPGILVKDMLASRWAKRIGKSWQHLVVDHVAYDPGVVDVPMGDGQRLGVEPLRLFEVKINIPPGCQAEPRWRDVQWRMDAWLGKFRSHAKVDLDPLYKAVQELAQSESSQPARRTMAEGVQHLLWGLVEKEKNWTPWKASSEILRTLEGMKLVRMMLADAEACVAAYNKAVLATPEAGLLPLEMTRERVELPLWQLAWEKPPERVYADIADAMPMLCDANGERIDLEQAHLAPRALCLTALMRSAMCDVFIHGKGGGLYDRAMEKWWANWQGTPLSPMVVASADVYLNFPDHDLPIATSQALQQAKWYLHHLPHNVDRYAQQQTAEDEQLAKEKQRLLSDMAHTQDRQQKQALFQQIHRINKTLSHRYTALLEQASQQYKQAQIGVQNHTLAKRRDWSIAFYPPEQLASLARDVDAAIAAGTSQNTCLPATAE